MNTPLYIAKRIVFNAQPSFSRFIIRLAVCATAISVAAMIITLSLVNGFQHTVAEKVYSFWGHARVQALAPLRAMMAEEETIERTPAIDSLINSNSQILNAYAFAAKSVVVKSRQNFEGVMIKGVDRGFREQGFEKFLKHGRTLSFADTAYSKDLLLSEQTARQLEVNTGDTVQVIFIRQGENIRSRNLTVSGIYRTGIEEYDRNFALADLRFLQKLNLWDSTRIGGYEIWLGEPDKAELVARQLSEDLPQAVVAQSIRAIYPNIFDWLSIQNQTKIIVIIIMTAVAIINLVTCLLILVMERTRMVGALKAFGLPDSGIRLIFWYYASWIAITGIGAGLFISLALLWLQQATGLIRMDEATYYVDRMPVKMVWWQVVAVVSGSFIVCVAALRLPLFFVNRISPVKALRFS